MHKFAELLGGCRVRLADVFSIVDWLSWQSMRFLFKVRLGFKFAAEKSNLSSRKSGHTTGGSGWGAWRGGGAGSGRTGCQQNFSPRRQASLIPPKASNTRRLNDSREARTCDILCKPMGEQIAVGTQFITVLFAVYQRDERRSFPGS